MRVFVYGTLRKGYDLWPTIKDSVLGEPIPARAGGSLYYEPTTRAYPVFVSTPTEPIELRHAHGELHNWFRTAESLWTIHMELAAGYNAEWIDVEVQVGYHPDHPDVPIFETVSAIAFTYHHDPRLGELVPVPGNNWVNAEPDPWPTQEGTHA